MKHQLKKQISLQDNIKSNLALALGSISRVSKSPDEQLGELFDAVQTSNLFSDGKTFIDLIPRKRLKAIYAEYQLAKNDPVFNLDEFIKRHFYEFAPHKHAGEKIEHNNESIDEHIDNLWGALTRRNRKNRGSLITLPHHYIVPGGRFSEQFYWDTYFIMLGLAAKGYWDDIDAMMKNYTFMIRKFGFIPTANRTYFLSRSQPPFFVMMVKLLASHRGKRVYIEYLPYLLAEYSFWMKGKKKASTTEHKAYLRVVQMPSGAYLNRYYDNKLTPRPDTYVQDTERAHQTPHRQADRLYLHLRAGAESGWDFSSRWFNDPTDINTIHTADIVPVDLNCMLLTLEATIAETYRMLKNPLLAAKYEKKAQKRKEAIQLYLWDEKTQFYQDYNFHIHKVTGSETLAAVFPLYAGIASQEQAAAVAQRLERDFLKPGGLVTTCIDSGEQWDSPNGWAPLQWVAFIGLRKYGFVALADEIKRRWLSLNEKVYDEHHMLIEKYDVVNESGLGGGGEYVLQEGFGWTNGVYVALKHEELYDATSS